MERLPTSRDFNDHFDLGTIALLLTKASEESMTWPRVLINEQKDPNTLPNQAATTSGILHYLKGFRIAHQSIIAQIKKRYPEEVTQVKEDVEHQTAQLSTFTREIL
ncbi:hypothetical protein KKF03_02100, partial [Patescibacteria group bacterium]|nr:hypothetical protein [Patescibacteria group bacterium]